ncbi:MAG TPA: [protein-PII] uridylyltransferase [Candidatus Kapabacteria bacterium]|nr:[protein-PII] uridylyltransferase [Candidatus Kapabacteria bacterium]
MASLADKIEADASTKLVLPEDTQPSDVLSRYKAFLKLENSRLQMLHRSGASGREVSQARATLLDVLLRHILEPIQAKLEAEKTPLPNFALIAIGGYGRGELNPSSDIDIMFLHDTELTAGGKAKPQLGALTDGLLYTLWDLGLKVGHSVRTVEDCVKVANSDMQSKTSLIEARLVTGSKELFDRMQAVVVAKCVRGFEDAYIQARITDQATRRAKYGNSPFMQEPNIKNGCGGLRDYQNLLWMAFFKYRTRTLDELEEKGLVTASEKKQLDTAYDFLLWTRNELHYTAKRAVDVLSKNFQPSIAHARGYTNRSPSKRLEEFMRDVYTHMRHIYLITRTLEERLALLPSSKRIPSLRDLFRAGKRRVTQQVVDGFVIQDGQISETTRSFKEQPRRLMRLFLYMQQRGLRLHPDLAQSIRNQLSLVNREFIADEHVRETFLEILNQRGNVAPILRSMHEVGLLGKYIPEFGRLTCLVQHEFYHQYTADEHTLVCIQKLDEIWEATNPAINHYSQLLKQIERPFILYLALLLHDAGKAFETDDHSDVGANISLAVAERLALDGATAHSLRILVENHLLMAQVSQRRDLEDPDVIGNFVSLIQTRENAMMLTLMTYADSLGTSDQLWNSFKDSLLWTLFSRSMDKFSGATELKRAEARQLELLKEEVTALLPGTFSPEEIAAHFEHLPPRYFQIHSARQIVADISLTHRFMHLQLAEEDKALEPIVVWHNEPDRGYTSIHICTWDRAGLFAKIAGSLASAGLNILSAQIFTRSDGIILDTFFVNDAHGAALAKKEEKEAFEKILNQSLTMEPVDFPTLIAKRKGPNRIYQSLEGDRIPTVIGFDNQTSSRSTILDIETEDRVGLLYYISRTLADLGLDISLAKILTEKGAAVDTFYITTWDKKKITSEEHQSYIEHRLQEAINALDQKKG